MMIDLDEIERRANAATPGPWTYHDGCGYVEVPPCGAIEFKPGWERSVHFLARVHNNHVEGEDGLGFDGAFIAHARTDVPALIARVRELEEEQAEAHAVWEQTERTGIHTDGTRELADALGICEGKMTADGVARFALQRVRELEAERPCAIDQLDATMARMELHTVTEERNAFMRSHAILRAIHGALTDALPNTPIPALDSFDVVELVRALAKDMKP
jgi:hypothetical protein